MQLQYVMHQRLSTPLFSCWVPCRLPTCDAAIATRFELNFAFRCRARYLPDAIHGDLDSIRPDVIQFYSARGISIKDLSEDQDTTDLMKCIMFVEQLIEASATPAEDKHVIVMGTYTCILPHH